jgi:hypothetical protein
MVFLHHVLGHDRRSANGKEEQTDNSYLPERAVRNVPVATVDKAFSLRAQNLPAKASNAVNQIGGALPS